jgi:hypothetical protein
MPLILNINGMTDPRCIAETSISMAYENNLPKKKDPISLEMGVSWIGSST